MIRYVPPVVELKPATQAAAIPVEKPSSAVPVEIPGTGALAIFAERAEEAAKKAEAAADKVEEIAGTIEGGAFVADIEKKGAGFVATKGDGKKNRNGFRESRDRRGERRSGATLYRQDSRRKCGLRG